MAVPICVYHSFVCNGKPKTLPHASRSGYTTCIMFILENVPLREYSTMRLGGIARALTEINNRSEVGEAVAWAKERNLPILMIGGGSNIFWKDEGFEGLVLVNKIMGYEVFSEDEENTYIMIGAGESWDSVVERAVASGKSGVEYLSYIPGTAGGAPVQNIGAYGHELSEALTTVEVFDTQTGSLANLQTIDCGFGYRTSRFKTTDRGRFLITGLTLHLTKPLPTTKYYHWLEEYFAKNNIQDPTPNDIRNAVIEIRKSRLPDPARIPNNGSFFANPIVSADVYEMILMNHPKLASWPTPCFWRLPDGTYKIAAGALLEYAGFKDFHDTETGMATWYAQALVFVNENAKSTADLLAFREKITSKIQELFGITLTQEPELLP